MKLYVIKNSVLPFKGFRCLTILSMLFVRSDLTSGLSAQELRHEKIHAVQQYELLLASLVALSLVALCGGISWWWLLATPAVPFALYLLCWMAELLLPPYGAAYRNVCFETEAIYNEADPNYLRSRRPFAWVRYVSNRRYPYLPHKDRAKRETK